MGSSGKVSNDQQIEEKKGKSELAHYIWKLKEEKIKFSEWKIEKKAHPGDQVSSKTIERLKLKQNTKL